MTISVHDKYTLLTSFDLAREEKPVTYLIYFRPEAYSRY